MARPSYSLTTFNNGALTPYLVGHVDFPKYNNSVDTLNNMMVLKWGPVSKRPGIRFVNQTKTGTEDSRLIPFEFSTTQTYVIEFGDLYTRFFANQGFIETVPASGVPFELVSQYTEAQIRDIKYTQSADVLFLAHQSHITRKLNRIADNNWNFEDIGCTDGPYNSQNTDATRTLNPSGTTGTKTITAVGFSPFVSTDVGRLIRLKHSGTWGYAKITVFNSTTSVDAAIQSNFASGQATSDWRLGAWSETTGFPAVTTFHQGRLVFGGGTNASSVADPTIGSLGPQVVWMSKSNDFENFAPTELDDTVSDDNAITRQINTDQVNAIQWMKSGRVLMIGTTGAEFKGSADNDGVITPTNFSFTRESQHGSSKIDPQLIGSGVVFLQRAQRRLRELAFEFAEDALKAPDVSKFGEHLTVGGIKEMFYQQEPNSILWMIKNDGDILSFTYDKDENVLAFGEHPLGGTDSKGVSVTSISSETTNRDEVWFITEHTIGGVTVKHVGFLEKEFDHDTLLKDAFFVDSGLTFSGAPSTVITGLSHLEGETVSILADGAVAPDQVVSGGQITLSSAASDVHVGLGYTSLVKTLPPEVLLPGGAGAPSGTIQGNKGRIYQMTFRLYRSLGLKFGDSLDELEVLPFRKTSDLMDTALPLFIGDITVPFNASWENERRQAFVVQDQPLPMTITGLVTRMNINEP